MFNKEEIQPLSKKILIFLCQFNDEEFHLIDEVFENSVKEDTTSALSEVLSLDLIELENYDLQMNEGTFSYPHKSHLTEGLNKPYMIKAKLQPEGKVYC